LRPEPDRLLPLEDPLLEELPRLLLEAERFEAPDDDAFERLDEERLPPLDDGFLFWREVDFFSPSSTVPRQEPVSSSSISM
jgi:hypothetical protein